MNSKLEHYKEEAERANSQLETVITANGNLKKQIRDLKERERYLNSRISELEAEVKLQTIKS